MTAPALARPYSGRSPELDAELRERLGPPPEIVGGPERTCVSVPPVGPEERKVIRSGEMLIGGHLPGLAHGKGVKLWWRRLVDASLEMELSVRGWRLDAPEDPAAFRIGGPTAPRASVTLEPYADEAFFPGGVTFPSPGTWIVVGSTGRSWGCFLVSVP